jgi:hypothetical protein
MTAAQQPAPDLDTRDRAAAAKMVMRLFDHWKLSSTDQLALLGLNEQSRSTLARYREGRPLANTRDLMDRVAYLLDIHAQLRLIFPKERNFAYGWMTAKVKHFDNLTPLEIVKQHGIVGLNMLRAYLDKVRGE